MEYRKNPLTGDWILYPSTPKTPSTPYNTSPLYEKLEAPYLSPVITLQNNYDLMSLSPIKIYDFFDTFKTTIQTSYAEKKTVYIHSIIKPCCTSKQTQYPAYALAVPAIDKFLDKSIVIAREYYANHSICSICAMVQEETEQQERIILQTDTFTALFPFFQRFPYETWIIPTKHSAQFSEITDTQLHDFSSLCHNLFHRIHTATDNADFSIHIHHIIVPTLYHYCVHWYLEIIPWTTNWAGFEIETGMNINIVSPETCIENLSKFH